MALSSLRFDARADVEEPRSGMFIFDGMASRYHEWEFRTMLKWEAVQDDEVKRKQATSAIVDSLRGDAAQIAMDIGRTRLMAEDGVPQLAAALLSGAFPKQRSEANDGGSSLSRWIPPSSSRPILWAS